MPHTDGKTYVTVNTDAGFKDGVVTFGIWISSEQGRFKYAGRANHLYTDSTEGELIAICNAIRYLHDSHAKILDVCDILIFNTDSTNAIHVLRGNTQPKIQRYVRMYDYFHKYLTALKHNRNFKTVYKHVKGHKHSKHGAKHYVNNWCDQQARALRKEK